MLRCDFWSCYEFRTKQDLSTNVALGCGIRSGFYRATQWEWITYGYAQILQGRPVFSRPKKELGASVSSRKEGEKMLKVHNVLLLLLACLTLGDAQTVVTNPTASQTIAQPVSGGTTTSLNINNLENARYADQFNWIQSPSANLSVAGSNKTITLTPCPVGVDNSANTNAQYYVYIATQGTPEAVPVIAGGTCTSGAASGTIVVNTVNTHSPGYTVQSASAGIREAVDDAGTNANIILSPTPNASPYVIYAPLYVNANKATIWAYGSVIQCNTRSVCVFLGDLAGGEGYLRFLGGRFEAGINIDGAQITNVSLTSNVVTVTTAGSTNYSLTANAGGQDIAWVKLKTVSGTGFSYQGMAKVTPTSGTTFTFPLNHANVTSVAAFGWTALENAAIEDNADGSTIRDTNLTSLGFTNVFHFGFVNDNDQKMTIDDVSNEGSGNVLRCTANFCGSMVLGRGDNGNAGIFYLKNSELSFQCNGNGVENYATNNQSITDTIIQGFAQFGVLMDGETAIINNMYQETSGACPNPIYPNSLAAAAGVINHSEVTISGEGPVTGWLPQFANTGATQRNYYIVPQSSLLGTGPILLVGFALENGAGTVNIYWPQITSENGGGTITYDVLITTGSTAIPPYLGSATSITTGVTASACTNAVCTFADTLGAGSGYSYAGQAWEPELTFWPAAVVISENINRAVGFGSNTGVFAFTTDNWVNSSSGLVASAFGITRPSVTSLQCSVTQQSNMSPAWLQCLNGPMGIAPLQYATLFYQVDTANNGPTNKKGKLNFPSAFQAIPYHIITWGDANPAKTASTPGHRPGYDANDCYTGFDQGAGGVTVMGLSFGCSKSISNYIGNDGDNSSYLERLTASLKLFTVPIQTSAVAFASLPTCNAGAEGTERAITDSTTNTQGATITGAGSNHVLAYCNGANWVVATGTGSGSLSVNASALTCTGGGTAQAQTATCSPTMSALTRGNFIMMTPSVANTAAAPTLAVDSLTAKNVTKCGTTALVANDITSTTGVEIFYYDGTQFQLLNPQSIGCQAQAIQSSNGWEVAGGGTVTVGTVTANTTKMWAIFPASSITSTKIGYHVTTADNSGHLYDIGVYDGGGNLKCHLGATAGTTFSPSTGARSLSWTTTCTLIGGSRYYLAQTDNAATATIGGEGSFENPNCFSNPTSNNTTSGGVLNGTVTPAADSYAACTMPQITIF
jgi:hypothetical protein